MLLRHNRRHTGARRRRGQSLVEFAVAMAIIMVFLFGIIDWGIAYHMHQRIVHQASEAARWVSIRGPGIDNALLVPGKNIVLCGKTTCTSNDFVPSGLTSTMVNLSTVIRQDATSSLVPGGDRKHIVVTITGYQYQMFTPFFGRLLTPRAIVVSHPMECMETVCPEVPSYTP